MEGFRHRFSGLFSELYFGTSQRFVEAWLMRSISHSSPRRVLGYDNLLSVALSTQVKMGTGEFNARMTTHPAEGRGD